MAPVAFSVRKTVPYPPADVARAAMDYTIMKEVYGSMAASKYEVVKEGAGVPYGKGCVAKLTMADGGVLTEETTDASPPLYFKKQLRELIKPSRVAPAAYTLEVRLTVDGGSTTIEFAIQAELHQGCWACVQASFFQGAQREALSRIASYLERNGVRKVQTGGAPASSLRKCLVATPLKACVNKQLDQLTSDEVFVLMHHFEFGDHAQAFRNARITGASLAANITEEDLQPLGMTSSLRCKGLLQRVEILKQSGVPNKMLVPKQPMPAATFSATPAAGESAAESPNPFAGLAEGIQEAMDTSKNALGGLADAVMQPFAGLGGGSGPKRGSMDRGRGRRAQVIGQKVEVPANWRAPVFPKTPEDLEFLQEVCMSDSLFKSLNQSDVEMIMRAFQPVKFNQGSTIITQGDPGDKIYVIHTGECDIAVNGKSVMKAKRGVKFGELALLHNAPRAATVTAESPVNTFSLDGTTFKAIMMGKAQQDTKDYLGFIQEVRILQSLPKADQMRLIDALQEREYAAGARIIKEGDEGDYFYIIRDGEVKCTQEAAGGCEVSKRLTKGDFFGELALLSAERRAATVVATKKTQEAGAATYGKSQS